MATSEIKSAKKFLKENMKKLKTKKASQLSEEHMNDLECIVFTDKIENIIMFISALKDGIASIPQSKEDRTKTAYFEEMVWRKDV